MPKRPTITKIALAHDALVMVANGDTPIEVTDDLRLLMGLQADTLGWVLGEESELGKTLERVTADLAEHEIEVIPRPDLVN